jgi:citrate lyase subunit beta/citryl-CoA lyase
MEPVRSWLNVRDPASPASAADVSWFRAGDAGAWRPKVEGRDRRIAVLLSPVSDIGVEAELDALMPLAPWAVILPRCRGGADVQRLGAKLAVREARLGLDAGVTRIVAGVGGAAGTLQSSSLARASPRLLALVADAEGLKADLGAAQAPGAVALMRALTVIAAASAGVAAIDGARAGSFDPQAARAEAEASWAEGFRGKIAMRPEEVAIYNEVFASRS